MSASNYKPSLALMLAHEGGYVNHPLDPGGATNRGVTQKVYDAYRKYYGLVPRSVKELTNSEIGEIYNKNYWKLCRADSLPAGLDYAVFDFAVNSGVSRAVRYLQRAIGVEDDGIIGLVTLSTIEAKAKEDLISLIVKYCGNRMAFLQSLPTFDTFGRGWTRRVIGYKPGYQENDNGVIDYAITMAKKDAVFSLPKPIGTKPGETAGKAIQIVEAEAFPTMESTHTPQELKELMGINDTLAAKILND